MVSSPYHRLALLALIFALHGGGLCAAQPISKVVPHQLLEPFGVGWLMGLGCWWAIWPALRAGSNWRGWLEGLTIMGASYGTVLLIGMSISLFAARPTHPAQPADWAIVYLYASMSVAIIDIAILMIVFLVIQFITRWLLDVPNAASRKSRQFNMGEMLLLITVVALHLLTVHGLLRDAMTWDWSKIRSWWLTGITVHLAMLSIPTILVFLAPVVWILVERVTPWVPPAMFAVALVTFCVIYAAFHHERPFLFSLLSCLGITANATVTSLALHWIGFRLTGGRPLASQRDAERALPASTSLSAR
jgi:hypothetical protein